MAKIVVGIKAVLTVIILFLLNASLALAQVGTISIQAKEKTAYTIVYLSLAILLVLVFLFFLIKKLFKPIKKGKGVQHKHSSKSSGNTSQEKVEIKPFYDKDQIRKDREDRIRERKRGVVVDHLKDDERQIIEILKSRDGVCEQGTLKVITDFSKAKLSELLAELANRKILIKKKKGRKNLIILAEP